MAKLFKVTFAYSIIVQANSEKDAEEQAYADYDEINPRTNEMAILTEKIDENEAKQIIG